MNAAAMNQSEAGVGATVYGVAGGDGRRISKTPAYALRTPTTKNIAATMYIMIEMHSQGHQEVR